MSAMRRRFGSLSAACAVALLLLTATDASTKLCGDVNDDGVWQPGEPFIDVNMNGLYDGPNGKWDADTVIWAETRILYSGIAAEHNNVVEDEFSRFFAFGISVVVESATNRSRYGPSRPRSRRMSP